MSSPWVKGWGHSHLGRSLCVLVLVGAACYAAYEWWHAAKRVPQTLHGLFIRPEHLNFGLVWEQHDFRWTIPVENHGAQDIHILEFVCCAPGVTITPKQVLIPRGQGAEIQLRIDLTGRPTKESRHYVLEDPLGTALNRARGSAIDEESQPVRDFRIGLRPSIEGVMDHDLGWVLVGRARRILSPTPSLIEFETIRGQPCAGQTVLITPYVELADLKCRCDPSLGRAELSSEGRRLQVCPVDTLPIGRFAFDVTLEPTTLQGELLPALRVPVKVQVVCDVRSIPSAAFMGTGSLGEILTETVVLQSSSGRGFVVERIHCTSGDLTVEGASGSLASVQSFEVKQRISHVGAQKNRVDFVVAMSAEERHTIPVEVSYYGRAVRSK